MTARSLIVVVAVSASLSVSTALADPPRTCGRIQVHGALIVRVHQLKCRTGIRWARAYAAHRAVPRGYTCTPYRGPMSGIPWVCRNNRVSYREFWVIQPVA